MFTLFSVEPFALWEAARLDPTPRPRATVRGASLERLNLEARLLGLKSGGRAGAALVRVPQLELLAPDTLELELSWEKLLLELSQYTPRLESPQMGRVFLDLPLAVAQRVCAEYGARGGRAAGRELALLAAHTAGVGQVREALPGAEAALLEATPLAALEGFGLTPSTLERLRWLGLTTVGKLMRWSAAQRAYYLGKEAGRLERLLKPGKAPGIALYTPPLSLSARHDFENPACEPFEVDPQLERLVHRLNRLLEDRTAPRLRLTATAQNLRFEAARVAKTPLREKAEILRLAVRLLEETGAQPLGLERLELSLEGVKRDSVQPRLFPQKLRGVDVFATLEPRFQSSFVTVRWKNPYALSRDRQFVWMGLLDGRPRIGRKEAALAAGARNRPNAAFPATHPSAFALAGPDLSGGAVAHPGPVALER